MNDFIIVHENVLDGSSSSSSTGISIRKNLALNTRSMLLIFLGSVFGAIVVSIFDQWAEVHPEKPSKPSSISKSDGKIKIQNDEPSVLDSVKVAWLMSFPNSGTSFTLKMIRHISRKSTASNYGEKNRYTDGNSVPVYSNNQSSSGPFWTDPTKSNPNFTHPTKYVLTKTHCGGRCQDCPPEDWVENTHSFLLQCLTGKRGYVQNGTKRWEFVTYDKSVVGKAVHLIRDPFDNIVSRFHLKQHSFHKLNDTEKLEMYPLRREGFRAFCSLWDNQFVFQENNSRFLDSRIFKNMNRIPCHTDFFRFVQWHNLAFIVTTDMDIPTYVLHYEDYSSQLVSTVSRLVEFLELPSPGDLINFTRGKGYHHYYTRDERVAIREAMKALSLRITWEHLSKYFEIEEY